MSEIVHLQEQVTLLTIENDNLQKNITKNASVLANAPSTGAPEQHTAYCAIENHDSNEQQSYRVGL